MASVEFEEFQRAAAANATSTPPPAGLEERRRQIDEMMGPLPLAAGTTAEVTDAGGVPCITCRRTEAEDDTWIVYFHGGGYRIGSALAYRAHCSHLAAAARAKVLVVDYRLAPEHAFPAAVDDAVRSYDHLLEHGVPPSQIVLGGDSAGGGLTVAALLALRDRGTPLPAGGLCLSPWVDLTNSGPSFTSRADRDLLFSLEAASEAAELYLQGADATDPLASPVFGDLTGLPPLLVLVGTEEVLVDDAERLAVTARRDGVDVEHSVYDDMPHVWQLSYPAFPEAVHAVEQIARFVHATTTTPPGQPQVREI